MTLSDADVGNHVLYVAANDGTGLSTPVQVTIAITDVTTFRRVFRSTTRRLRKARPRATWLAL